MIAYLPFRNYPPTIDVLLTTTAALSRAGYSRLLVDWWDMFPWSIQFAPVPRYAYTEVEIDAFAQYASSLELEIIPVISLYASGSPILSLPALSHLRKDDELCVDLNAPGIIKTAESLVEDVKALLPYTNSIYLPIGSSVRSDPAFRDSINAICRRASLVGVRLMVADRASDDRGDVSMWHSDCAEPSDESSEEHHLGIEAALDSMVCRTSKSFDESSLKESSICRSARRDLEADISDTWAYVRLIWEASVRSAIDSRMCFGCIANARIRLSESNVLLRRIEGRYDALLMNGRVNEIWLRERRRQTLGPLREAIGHLDARIEQFEGE